MVALGPSKCSECAGGQLPPGVAASEKWGAEMCFSHCMNPSLATATLGVGEMSSTHPRHCTQWYSGVGREMMGAGRTDRSGLGVGCRDKEWHFEFKFAIVSIHRWQRKLKNWKKKQLYGGPSGKRITKHFCKWLKRWVASRKEGVILAQVGEMPPWDTAVTVGDWPELGREGWCVQSVPSRARL